MQFLAEQVGENALMYNPPFCYCMASMQTPKDGERLLSNSVVGCAVGQVFFDDCKAGAVIAGGATIIDDQTK